MVGPDRLWSKRTISNSYPKPLQTNRSLFTDVSGWFVVQLAALASEAAASQAVGFSCQFLEPLRSVDHPYTSSAMESIYPLIEHYGYLIVFFGVMLGTTGIPFPSAAILLAAGVLVQQDHLELRDAILFGTLGAIIGNQIGYWIGHRAGRPFVLKWGQYVKLTPERLERLEGLFERHGGKAVFAARFFSVSRLLEALIAGMSRMHWGTFLFYSVLGGAVWATAVVLVGYFFGESWGSAQGWSGRAPLLLVLLGVALGFYLTYRWTTSHRSR
jgi:membrane protein DedA with SNARE-associated domain